MGREGCQQGRMLAGKPCSRPLLPLWLRDQSPFSSCQAPLMDLCPEKGVVPCPSPGRTSAGAVPGAANRSPAKPEPFTKKARQLPAPGPWHGPWGFGWGWCSRKPGIVRLGGCAMHWGPCAILPWGYDIPAAPYLGCLENMGQPNKVKVFVRVRLEPMGDEHRPGGSTMALGAEFAALPSPLWAVVWDLCIRAAFPIAPDAVPAASWPRGASSSLNPVHPQRGTVRSDP